MNRLNFALLLLTLVLSPAVVGAQDVGGLIITPNRIVMEGRDREARITLTNSGSEEGTYRIFFVNYEMTPEGQFERVTTATEGANHADQFLRYSPRQVKLPPGKTQIIRVQFRGTPNLASGEYRTHMVFQALPKTEEVVSKGKDSTQAAIRTLYGVSIPVIVRRGQTDAAVSIGDVDLVEENGRSYAQFGLARKGSQSVYGNVAVSLVEKGKEPVVIGESNGLAVYTPLTERKMKVPLTLSPKELAGKRIEVTFTDGEGSQKVTGRRQIDVR